MRRIACGIATALIGLGGIACTHDQPAPVESSDEIQGIQVATDAYVAYQHSDCETVYQLTQPAQVDALQATELRHSLRLVRGFCQELDGDQPAARATYVQLIDEAPRRGIRDSRVAFVHPKSTGSVLTEIVQPAH